MTKLMAYVMDLIAAAAQPSTAQTQLQPVRVARDAPKRDLLTRR